MAKPSNAAVFVSLPSWRTYAKRTALHMAVCVRLTRPPFRSFGNNDLFNFSSVGNNDVSIFRSFGNNDVSIFRSFGNNDASNFRSFGNNGASNFRSFDNNGVSNFRSFGNNDASNFRSFGNNDVSNFRYLATIMCPISAIWQQWCVQFPLFDNNDVSDLPCS